MTSTHTKQLKPTLTSILRLNVCLFLISFSISLPAQNWNQILKATALDGSIDDFYGYSAAMSGDYAIIGSIRSSKDVNNLNEIQGAGAAYIFKRIGTTWIQEAKIVASDRATFDQFGYSVSISGDYVIVGAWNKGKRDTVTNFVNPEGAAYIFKRTGSTWTQQAKIVASDKTAGDQFGISVAIRGDYAIVGAYKEDNDVTGTNIAYDAGAAYIFKRVDSTWTQEAKIVASVRTSVDLFGYSVAINGDYAFVGAVTEDEDATESNTLQEAGAVYVFKRTGTNWAQTAKIIAKDRATNSQFGNAIATNGDYLIIGAYFDASDAEGMNPQNRAGSAYIFKRTGSTWTQEVKFTAKDRLAHDQFGISVDINDDYAIVGAYLNDTDTEGGNYAENAGAAYIFKRTGTTWASNAKVIANDRSSISGFGRAVAINNSYALVSTPFADKGSGIHGKGAAYFFEPTIEPIKINIVKQFKIYPIPTTGLLNVIREPAFTEGEYFEIVNVLGQIVMRVKAAQEIDVSNLPQGAFFLKIGDIKAKFIKQ